MGYAIAIDGPAGAGKSTIAKRIAKELSYIYVDTGAMYRAMAIHFIRNGVGMNDFPAISSTCGSADITIEYHNGEQVVLLNGESVNGIIRTEEVGNMASATSANPDVRKKLVELQQKMAVVQNVVMDGRDIGTVVLPNATLKVYLTADVSERAKRRYLEFCAKGMECTIEEIEEDIRERDERDMNREHSPLRQADDAVLVDSSNMTIDEVVEEILRLYRERV